MSFEFFPDAKEELIDYLFKIKTFYTSLDEIKGKVPKDYDRLIALVESNMKENNRLIRSIGKSSSEEAKILRQIIQYTDFIKTRIRNSRIKVPDGFDIDFIMENKNV